ncbi:kelch repeat-containing protein [Gemmatirosa kalamazoonensis]|nr:kelch repeat-containing protein [Gemmatirosa kalamazoonensis]
MLIALTVACADPTAPTRPHAFPETGPRHSTATASSSAFAFLPPISPAATAPSTLDSDARPTVDVCVAGTDGGCGTVVASFTFGSGERDVRLDAASQQYIANWKTKQCVQGPCTLSTDPAYRIRVRTAARGEIGSIDVRLIDGSAKATGGAGVATFQNGSTVPIKFWIAKTTSTWAMRAASPASGGQRVSAVYVGEDNAVFALYSIPYETSPFTVWRFDLTTDAWRAIPADGLPDGLQTRQLVHDPTRHELLTFEEGLGPVWALPETGGTWHRLSPWPWASAYNGPVAFWHPGVQRLAFFGGYGFFTWHNDLWSYDRSNATWIQLAQSSLRPMPRFGDAAGIDETGGALFLGGGQGYPTGSQFDGALTPNDLWRLDFATNAWTQVLPNDPTREATFIGAALDVVPEANAVYRFGGLAPLPPNRNGSVWEVHPDLSSARNVLERLDLATPLSGWRPVTARGAAPSARWSGGLFYDPPRHRLLVVGGSTTAGAVLDVYSIGLP